MNAKDEAHVPSYCRYLLTALCGAHAKHSRAQTSPKEISTHGYLVLTAAWKEWILELATYRRYWNISMKMSIPT